MTEMILPSPGASFVWRRSPAGPLLVCGEIEHLALHAFTTRHWLLGQAGQTGHDASDKMMGSASGSARVSMEASGAAAWADVAGVVGVPPDQLVRLRQVHGRAVVMAVPGHDVAVADILLTDDPSLAIAVQSADCVPLLIVDPVSKAVAAAHAGWRGMAARVPETAVKAMAARFGTRPADVIVAAGPSIGACCYEVGRDVLDAFVAAGFASGEVNRWFLDAPAAMLRNPTMSRLSARAERESAHWFFDGWRSVRDQLEMAGVAAGRILSAELCTASHPDALCSYRRDGSPAGRMAAVIRPGMPRP